MTDIQPDASAHAGPVPVVLDVNAVVSYNIKAIRERRGWTQQSVAERLGDLTGHQLPQASISAMERSFDGDRKRRFDAHELYLLSVVFDVPITYFFMPPPHTGDATLTDTERPVTDLFAATIGTNAQQAALGDRVDEIHATNPDHSDTLLATIHSHRDDWRRSYQAWRSQRIDDVAHQCGDRLGEAAAFLIEFADALTEAGTVGYLQFMADRDSKLPASGSMT